MAIKCAEKHSLPSSRAMRVTELRASFQIEFGICDAKQFTGLQSPQIRDKVRFDFA